MKTFSRVINNKYQYIKSDTLYFDIETTGFIHTSSFTYMIGYFYKEDNNLIFTFLFAENKDDEIIILDNFNSILKSFSTICTFNGKAFDIPYLNWRFNEYSIKSTINDKISIDMSRDFKPLKTFLGMSSQKQKSYEEFLGHAREDIYNGGQLISMYKKYLENKSEELENIITLHNFDDLVGMAIITDMYQFIDIKNAKFYNLLKKPNELVLNYKLSCPFNKEYMLKLNNYTIKIKSNNLLISTKILKIKAKVFFNDYNNYYYLPHEDIAVHKSVAKFCKYKIKAKRETCYQYIESSFIQVDYEPKPLIKINFDDESNLIDINYIDSLVAINILNQLCKF